MTNGVSGLLMFFKNNGGIKAADANGNGVITKQELDNFIQDNGGNNEALEELWNVLNAKIMGSSGTINNYTNLTKEEVAVYEAIEQYTGKLEEKCPVVLKSAGWVGAVTSELLSSSFVKSLYTGNDNNSAILANLEKKAKAIETKVTVRLYSKILAENTYKLVTNYNSSADSQLQAILNNYASKCGDKGFDAIREDIQEIVNAYGKTADLANCSVGDLSLLAQYGYDVENNAEFLPMNDLQIAVLVKNIGNLTASDLPSGHDKFISFYQDAMTEYVAANTTGKTYADFARLKNSFTKEGFMASDQFKSANGKVSVIIALDLNVEKGTSYTYSFKNVKPEFLERLKATFGDKIATLLTTNASSLSIFNSEILPEIIKKAGEVVDGNLANFMTNGVLDVDKVYDEITTQALDAMEKFLAKGFGTLKVKDLNEVYDNLKNNWVDKASSEATKLNRERKAAIFYCDSIVKLGTSYTNAVNEVFGNNYTEEINSITTAEEIHSKIIELQAEVASIINPKDLSMKSSSWGTITKDETNGISDSTDKISLPKSAKDKAKKYIEQLIKSFDGTEHEKTEFKNSIYGISNIGPGGSKIDLIETKAELNTAMDEVKKVQRKYASQLEAFQKEWINDAIQEEISERTVTLTYKDSTASFDINPDFVDNEGNSRTIDSSRITYEPANDSQVSIDKDGKVTIKASSTNGTHTVVIKVKVDGVEVSQMKFTVVSQAKERPISTTDIIENITGWGDKDSGEGDIGVITGSGEWRKLTDQSFKDLYNSDFNIQLYITMDTDKSVSDYKLEVIQNLRTFGNYVKSALMTSGKFDDAILSQAIESVVIDFTSGDWHEYLIMDDDGTSSTDLRENLNSHMGQGGCFHDKSKEHIIGCYDDDHDDSDCWGVNFKNFVDAIIAKYNTLR